MSRVVHPDPDRVYACPECDKGGAIYEREGRGNAYRGDTSARFICEECSYTFNELFERDSKRDLGGFSEGSPARALLDMDPDDLGSESA